MNYYWNNQWVHGSGPIDAAHPGYKRFRQILAETYARYGRPIFVSETGTEGDLRPSWLAGIGAEVRAAMRNGVPIEGICLYPIANHPGWDDDRHCPNGLLDLAGLALLFESRRLLDLAPDPAGRLAYGPLAAELERQQELFTPYLQ